MFVSTPKSVYFVKFIGDRFPRKHKKSNLPIPNMTGTWYAVPGGDVQPRSVLESWAISNKIHATFQP